MSIFSGRSGRRLSGPDEKANGVTASLKNHPNTPPALFNDGAGLFAEIFGGSMVAANRMFILAMGAIVLAAIGGAVVLALLPLKTIETHIIEVNPGTGVVGKPVEVSKIPPSTAVIQAELAKWVEAVYTLDPLRTNDNFKYAMARSRDKAIGQFTEYRNREQVYKRLQQEPGLIREAKVVSVDASKTGLAFAFVNTAERTGRESEAKVRRLRLTLHYELDPPKDHTSLLANPLGIYVVFFNESEER